MTTQSSCTKKRPRQSGGPACDFFHGVDLPTHATHYNFPYLRWQVEVKEFAVGHS